MRASRVLAAALLGLLVWHGPSAPASALPLPPGVPDLFNPAVQEQFRIVLETQLGGDRDFPLLVLGSVGDRSPGRVLLVLDARNGTARWSLQRDPVIFLVLADSPSARRAFLDEGFAASGRASGAFLAGGAEEADRLLRELQESHRRYVRPGRNVPAGGARPRQTPSRADPTGIRL
jgi:hypothetical protein